MARLLLFLLPLSVAAQSFDDYRAFLIQHEGVRHTVYRDSRGIPHIGIGHRIQPGESFTRLSTEQINHIFTRDLAVAHTTANRYVSSFSSHPHGVKLVIVGLAFNVGSTGFARFKRFISSIESGNYLSAAAALRDSKWANQVPNRMKDYTLILEREHFKRIAKIPIVAPMDDGVIPRPFNK